MSFRTNRRTRGIFPTGLLVKKERSALNAETFEYSDGSRVVGSHVVLYGPLVSRFLPPLSTRDVYVEGVTVKPDIRGMGYGTKMIELLESELRNKGFKRILIQPVGESIPFWEKLGFVRSTEPTLELRLVWEKRL